MILITFKAKIINTNTWVIGDLFNERYIITKSKLNSVIEKSIKHIRDDVLSKECINDSCKQEHIQLDKMLNKLLVNERFENIYEIDPSTLKIAFRDTSNSCLTKFKDLQEVLKERV